MDSITCIVIIILFDPPKKKEDNKKTEYPIELLIKKRSNLLLCLYCKYTVTNNLDKVILKIRPNIIPKYKNLKNYLLLYFYKVIAFVVVLYTK